ncbi:MAG: ABC transporter ATP-binding protein [Novosphingobium sp.]|nr:ABC transporter ATP-binding protein [Novosphingobium sp.]
MSEFAIDVKGLTKAFGDKLAVNGVDLAMPRGQVWGFLGPNGSGKTTTIRMICGLLRPTAGSGSCLGFDILTEADKIKLRAGYMTQKFSFWTDLTIRENLEFVARLYQLGDLAGTVDTTLDELGLASRQHQLAGNLSGGWKQRLALAAVTMHEPELLLLDEPTAGVDPQARRDFWDEIHRITSERGVTALVSTHYMDEAERCDHIVYLANGELVTQGTARDIVARSGLVTFRAEGKGVRALSAELEGRPGIEHIAYFGSALHVSGTQRVLIESAVTQAAAPDVEWQEVRPTLEDAFIAMTHEAGVDERQHA